MRKNSSPAAWFLAIAAWAIIVVPVRAQSPNVGSQVPCMVPISWTVARVDARFGISEDDAMRAVREAGALWEKAIGVRLFGFGADDGYPITFEFDQRQAGVAERQARDRALESERLGIETRRGEVQEAVRAHSADVQEYERDAAELRTSNNEMARVSRQNDLSEAERLELERRADELEERARELQSRVRGLNRRSSELADDSDRLNEWIEAFRNRQTSHAGAFPEAPTQSGRYDETVLWLNGTVDSVERRIRIFQFSDYEELVLTVAHELGHAIGLGHAPGTGALMSEMIETETRAVMAGGITAVDLRMLTALCPDLGQGAVDPTR